MDTSLTLEMPDWMWRAARTGDKSCLSRIPWTPITDQGKSSTVRSRGAKDFQRPKSIIFAKTVDVPIITMAFHAPDVVGLRSIFSNWHLDGGKSASDSEWRISFLICLSSLRNSVARGPAVTTLPLISIRWLPLAQKQSYTLHRSCDTKCYGEGFDKALVAVLRIEFLWEYSLWTSLDESWIDLEKVFIRTAGSFAGWISFIIGYIHRLKTSLQLSSIVTNLSLVCRLTLGVKWSPFLCFVGEFLLPSLYQQRSEMLGLWMKCRICLLDSWLCSWGPVTWTSKFIHVDSNSNSPIIKAMLLSSPLSSLDHYQHL